MEQLNRQAIEGRNEDSESDEDFDEPIKVIDSFRNLPTKINYHNDELSDVKNNFEEEKED